MKLYYFCLLMSVCCCANPLYRSTQEAEQAFDDAWSDPKNLAIRLDDFDVNKALEDHYIVKPHITFTKEMIWDMERKKAWDPESYLPHAVGKASSRHFSNYAGQDEIFERWSTQRQWLSPEVFGDIFEEVYLNKENMLVTFIGKSGDESHHHKSTAACRQPLFHVQHGAVGADPNPKNLWKIVFLNPEGSRCDDIRNRLTAVFDSFDQYKLPQYFEVYMRKELNVETLVFKKDDL